MKSIDFLITPSIVFESLPPFSDNTRAVYDEFLRRGFDKKYKLTWLLKDNTCVTFFKGKETRWKLSDRNTLVQKIRNYGFCRKTKAFICCNRFLTSSEFDPSAEGDKCKSFYLSHGTPIKRVEDYYRAPEGIDYAISPAQSVSEIMARAFKINPEKYVVTGFPRNDILFRNRIDLHGKIEGDYKRIVLWYPTYRQHKNSAIVLKGSSMPLIHDAGNAVILNTTAKENGVLILLKPHFAQDMSFLRDMSLSNICIIDDTYVADLGISPYEFIAAADAMITDYSSVFFDYTLCDKPIAVVWEDIDDYRQFPGFVIDPEEYMRGAEKIYTINELCDFIEDVSNGIDRNQDERRKIRDLTNDFQDGKSAERVVDFIVEKAKLYRSKTIT